MRKSQRRFFNKLNRIIIYHLAKKGIILTGTATRKKKIAELIASLYPHQIQDELIRLGPKDDGGYLVPCNLDGIEACFSPGVDNVSGFEMDCLKYGMKIYMADKSIAHPKINVASDKYNFIKKFVGCTNNDDFITMDRWVESSCLSDNSDLLLQMDIEGDEYYSIINMSDSLIKRFRIILIEFHSLKYLWHPHFFNLAQIAFRKILQTHVCLHIHPNNNEGIDSRYGICIPEVAEFTFVRNDHAKIKSYASTFPHRFDADNNAKCKSIVLPKNWYTHS